MCQADINTFLHDNGINVMPRKVKKGFVFMLFKNDKLIKTGVEVYEDWEPGLRAVSAKVFKAINKQ